jgi:iron uptake system component EfeO
MGMLTVVGCGQPPPPSGQGADEETKGTVGETTAETTTVDVGGSPELEEAADEYEEYVVEQTALLADLTEEFTGAVIAGDVERAKELYAPARVPWERIEPIAAKLGDYDPNIDAREGDVPKDGWRGFHRIEKALWVENTTEGQEEYARVLLEDVRSLEREVEDLELEPVALVTGSVELLNEVSAGKITGEEELLFAH